MTIARTEMVPVSEREHGRLQHGMRSSEREGWRKRERDRPRVIDKMGVAGEGAIDGGEWV